MDKLQNYPLCKRLFQRMLAACPVFNEQQYLEKYKKLPSDVDRFNQAYAETTHFNFFAKFDADCKDNSVALRHREAGNLNFQRGAWRKALCEYTACALNAQTNEILAWAYANRASCLFKLGLFRECVEDINRALKSGYPARYTYELLQKRVYAQCMLKPVIQYSYERVPEHPGNLGNPQIMQASNSVKISVNAQQGRHVVATKQIEVGEIISIESPFCGILTKDCLIHCHDCLDLCYNPIPCNHCTQAVFCSDSCKMASWGKYHRYECTILRSFKMLKMEATHILALRTAIQLLTEDLGDLDNAVFDCYRSDEYREIHHLANGREKRSSLELLECGIIAALMFQLLDNYTSMFHSDAHKNVKEAIKGSLYRLMLIIPMNAADITEFTRGVGTYKSESVGMGLYAFYGLFNHSCCPNVEKFSHGNQLVLRAINTIKPGQQCFVSYGPRYATSDKMKRQAYLKNYYFFTCQCTACLEDWQPHYQGGLLGSIRIPLPLGYTQRSVELIGGNVDLARLLLPHFVLYLKACEPYEPWGDILGIKHLVLLCLKSLGNKRLF